MQFVKKKRLNLFLSLILPLTLGGCSQYLSQNKNKCLGYCGQDSIYAKYVNLVKTFIEDNFYINDTYSCRYTYVEPISVVDSSIGEELRRYHYFCEPNHPPQPSASGSLGPVYFNATVAASYQNEPILSVEASAFQNITTHTRNYVGSDIPQPGTGDTAQLNTSIMAMGDVLPVNDPTTTNDAS